MQYVYLALWTRKCFVEVFYALYKNSPSFLPSDSDTERFHLNINVTTRQATSHKQLTQGEERHDFTEPLPFIQIQNETTRT